MRNGRSKRRRSPRRGCLLEIWPERILAGAFIYTSVGSIADARGTYENIPVENCEHFENITAISQMRIIEEFIYSPKAEYQKSLIPN